MISVIAKVDQDDIFKLKDMANEAEWVEQKWTEFMNRKRKSNHIAQLWKIKLRQYKQAEKDGRIEQFISNEIWQLG